MTIKTFSIVPIKEEASLERIKGGDPKVAPTADIIMPINSIERPLQTARTCLQLKFGYRKVRGLV